MSSINDVKWAVLGAGFSEADIDIAENTIQISVSRDDRQTYDALCTELWKMGAEVFSCDPYSFASFVEFDRYLRDIAFDDEDIDTVFVIDMREGRDADPEFMSGVDANLREICEECIGLPRYFVIVE